MDRSRTIKFAAGEVDSLANYIQRKYYSKGFQTQKTPFEENGIPGLMVQIRNTADDLGGKVKTGIGLKSCAMLILKTRGDDLLIDVRAGSWLDKIFSMTVAWIVLWPLIAVGAWGAWKQKKLLDQVFIDAISYFANK